MKHGADIYGYAKKLKCTPNEIVDFSSNINLYDKPLKIKVDTKRYYDFRYEKLKNTIAKRYEIDKPNIALFNGASSAIFYLLNFLKQKDIYLYAPLYGEYEKASTNKNIYKINRFKNLYKKPKRNSIVVFVNPSTPDGKYYKLDKLFKIWKKQNCTVVLDESFLEFEGLKSYRKKIKTYKKLYIIQSFSKFYSSAGVRVGAIFSSKNNIKKFNLPMWQISSFDSEFLIKRLNDKKFIKKSKALHIKRKKELKKVLKKYFEVYKSNTNFFMVKCEDKNMFDKLLKNKILVRTCGSFDFLDDTYLRFAVKDKNDIKVLKAM